MTASTATTAGIRASDRLPSVAGERGAEVGLTTTRRYDRNHRAVLEDQAGLSVVVLAHATSDQPARHRERVLARGERAVMHPRIPLVRARPGAAARAGTKSSARLHAKHSHVTTFPQEPCPGPPGACYDASPTSPVRPVDTRPFTHLGHGVGTTARPPTAASGARGASSQGGRAAGPEPCPV